MRKTWATLEVSATHFVFLSLSTMLAFFNLLLGLEFFNKTDKMFRRRASKYSSTKNDQTRKPSAHCSSEF